MRYFITGTAGFIGFHLARRLLRDGHEVYGYDALTEYYDVALKQNRLKLLKETGAYHHTTARLENLSALEAAHAVSEAEVIIHLAAQAGVRYSLENPRAYVDTNMVGSYNVLEIARQRPPQHLLLASTSSVYGANEKTPFAETDKTDEPLTLYAASKKSMEVMGHAYAHLWKIPTTVFRFFTVYGPYGRPDMALFKFVDAIRKGEAIDVYGQGQMRRDFTYVDDLINSIISLVPVIPGASEALEGDTLSNQGPYRIVNMGGGQPVELMAFISTIEAVLGKDALMNMMPMQKGDVPQTYASTELLHSLTGVRSETALDDGVRAFVEWFESYYN